MISQRTRGLQNSLLLCQAGLVALALWVSMQIAFRYFAGSSHLHFDRYPIYGALLVLGLIFESLTRESEKIASNLFQKNVFHQHAISVRQTFFAAGTLFLYLAAAKDSFISRWVLAIDVPLLYCLFVGSNYFLPEFLARRIFGRHRTERALLIGSGSDALRLMPWLKGKEVFGFQAVGVVTSETDIKVPGLPWLGERSDLQRILTEQSITQVILLELPDSTERHEQLVDTVESHGARLLIVSNLEEKLRHRVIHFKDGAFDFIAPRTEPLEDPVNRALKRLLDLSIAVPITLFIIPPIAILVWFAQRIQSPGPLFYRQVRAGIQNRRFRIVKFRTMHVDNPDEDRQATRHDDRVYPVAHWLRRLSLDELPQFWNVITGEMSICGPRPHLVAHNADFSRQMRRYHLRAFVKPGITGLAQIRGFRGEIHSVADIEQRLESDIEYFENWRLTLDVAVIFRTALQIILFACDGLIRRRPKGEVAESSPATSHQLELTSHAMGHIYVSDSVRRNFRQILGIRFFTGEASEAVSLAMNGGLIVAPSAPVLLGLENDPVQRAAVRGSALAITDSGLMVLLWKLLTGEETARVSGLEYLKLLLEQPQLRGSGATLWVMPHQKAAEYSLRWLQKRGFPVTAEDCYLAPQYRPDECGRITDPALVAVVRSRRPAHVILGVGGGVQEKLGADLLSQLDYRPAVHCTGAAIGFLSGEQARIPMWADRFKLGWLFRCIDNPSRFIPRYWEARKLVGLMLQYHGRLPDRRPSISAPLSSGITKADHVTLRA
jgi:exopolysaccharide biosynthesis polyprenyl glycosylphosphotransferase